MDELERYRLSATCMAVWRRARELALRRGRGRTCPSHFLIAMVEGEPRESEALAVLLEECPRLPALLQSVEDSLGRVSGGGRLLAPALCSRVKAILRRAALEAEARGNHFVNCSHVTLAVLREEACPLTQALRSAGVDLEYVIHASRVHMGRGLLPGEFIEVPRAPRIRLWDFPEHLRTSVFVRNCLDYFDSLSDEQYQHEREVQIALAKSPRSPEAVRARLVAQLARFARSFDAD